MTVYNTLLIILSEGAVNHERYEKQWKEQKIYLLSINLQSGFRGKIQSNPFKYFLTICYVHRHEQGYEIKYFYLRSLQYGCEK